MRRRNACIGLLGVVLLVCFWLIYGHIDRDYHRTVFAAEDMFTGLVYFAEEHGGQFPASEQEFRSCTFVENLPDGGVRIIERPGSEYCPRAYGVDIGNLASFSIPWGLDVASLRHDSEGRVVNDKGREIRLMRVGKTDREWT